MAQYIDKSALVAEVERRIKSTNNDVKIGAIESLTVSKTLNSLISFINTLEVKDPYKQCVQYPSIEDGIKFHAEVYSFNIKSKLFNQLTNEQRALWRKEIEQAYISGGDTGVELARDIRYKENFEVKKADLEKEFSQ